MSAEFSKEEHDTRPSTPSSCIVRTRTEQEGLTLLVEFREALVEAGLTPDQMSLINRDLDQFAGPDHNSINIGAVYAYLVSELGFQHSQAGPVFKAVRQRITATVGKNAPPPPNTVSGEHRLSKAMPQIPKQNLPFTAKDRK